MQMRIDQNDFLGQGWQFPPTFSQGGRELGMVADAEDIQQSLHILLSTGLGERIMQENFGCDLQAVVFESISQRLINRINQQISDAIIYHEPRIKLEQVNVSVDSDDAGLLKISIIYSIRTTNSRFNLVYPFYLYETHLGAGLSVI
jgi:phage baseplate assembly protein W